MVVTVIFAAFLAAAFGSFAGVVSARGLRESLSGRSHCDGCRRTLAWYELVPLISYPALRGHCRTCHVHVGFGVFVWELGGALLAVAVALPITLALHLAAF
jgi:leader peptidase (prepilin peptidase)/N-methyltransferase